MEYLTLMDAETTAKAANKFIESAESDVESTEARELRDHAIFLRKIIDLLSEMRNPDYNFEYQKVEVKPATTQPSTNE